MVLSRRGKSSCWGAVFLAIGTALFCESFTAVFFYTYLNKENQIILEQRSALVTSEERNGRLMVELSRLNSSVALVLSGLGTANQAIDSAHQHLGSFEINADLRKIALAEVNSQLQALKDENSKLRSSTTANHDSGGGASPTRRWLTIGIPTVPRKGDPDYLRQTVEAIILQLPTSTDDVLYGQVMVVVLNNRPGQHTLFDQVRKEVERGPHSMYFEFVEQHVAETDMARNPEGNPNVPGSKVNIDSCVFMCILDRATSQRGVSRRQIHPRAMQSVATDARRQLSSEPRRCAGACLPRAKPGVHWH